MKKEGHPEYHNVCFEDVSTGEKILTRASLTTKEKITVNGVEYYRYPCEVTSYSHPAYTGEKRFVDTAGRVEKFQQKFRKRSS